MDANDVVRYQRALVLREQERRQPNCNGYYLGHSARTRSVRNSVWAAPFYDFLRANNDGNVSAATHSRIGFVTGYDRALSSRSSVGAVFAYSNPEMKQLHARVKADDYLFGVHYNTLLQNRYELKLWGSYGTQAYRMNRTIALPHADGRLRANYTGNTAAVSSQISMPVKWRDHVFRPFAALDVNYVQQNRATERGYDEIRLHYHCADWAQVLGRVGIKADYTYRRWDFSSTLSYSGLFAGSSAPTVRNQFVTDGPAFKIDGNDLGCSFGTFGLGARRWLNESRTRMLFLQYSGEYGRSSNAQTAMLGCQFVF
jgi:outer membrane autotransporter protein